MTRAGYRRLRQGILDAVAACPEGICAYDLSGALDVSASRLDNLMLGLWRDDRIDTGWCETHRCRIALPRRRAAHVEEGN